MSDGLVRVTAIAGGRRSDLAVPGGVAVAELVPDLARAVGLLDPAAVYAGYRLHARGRRLRPDRGLREQGVDDGALLAVTCGADAVAPIAHDDLAEAAAEVVDRQPAWRPADSRRTTLAAGLLAVVLGLGTLGWELLPPVPSGWSAPAAVVLTLAVLVGNALPRAAVALGVARADGVPVDPGLLEAMVARSTRLLVTGSAAVATVAVATVPIVTDDLDGAVLAGDCCLVLVLRARRHRARTVVLVDAMGGVIGLLAAAAALLVRQPDTRPVLACILLLVGAVLGAGSRLPAVPTVLRARLLDLLETLAVVALAPLLLLATNGVARIVAM